MLKTMRIRIRIVLGVQQSVSCLEIVVAGGWGRGLGLKQDGFETTV